MNTPNEIWTTLFRLQMEKTGDPKDAAAFATKAVDLFGNVFPAVGDMSSGTPGAVGAGNPQGNSDELARQLINNAGGQSEALARYMKERANCSYAVKGLIDEKRITYGTVYFSNKIDLQGEWATPDIVEKTAHDYLENYRWLDIEHAWEKEPEEAVLESFIAPCKITTYFGKDLGEDFINEGDWVMAKRWSAKNWESVKKGTITGFSIGGFKKLGVGFPPGYEAK